MPEKNAFGLPNGGPLYSLWSRTIRNRKVALRKLLDNARFVNASIVTDSITGALRVWRADFDQYADELTGRMTPYLSTIVTRSGNAVRTRVGQVRADDWFIRDTRRVQKLESTVLALCYDTIQSMHIEVDDKINLIRKRLIAGEIDDGAGGWTDLYSSLDDYFEESSVWRSLRIARTEGSRAANWGVREAAEELDDCIGFEWLLAPGACQACVAAGTAANGVPKRVAKGDPFVKNLGPKITNLGDPLRERRIPEEYRQIFFGPLHPNDRCSVKPIFKKLDGSQIEFHRPLDMGGKYMANSEEIKPVDLTSPGNFTDPGRPNVSNSGRVAIPKRSKSMPKMRLRHMIKPSYSGGMVDAIGTKASPGQVE